MDKRVHCAADCRTPGPAKAIEQIAASIGGEAFPSAKNSGGMPVVPFGAINTRPDQKSEPAVLLRGIRADVGRRIRERLERAVK